MSSSEVPPEIRRLYYKYKEKPWSKSRSKWDLLCHSLLSTIVIPTPVAALIVHLWDALTWGDLIAPTIAVTAYYYLMGDPPL